MKKIYLIITIIVSVCVVSCKKFLTEEPPSFVSATNYFKTESDARTACDGVYQMLQDGSGNSVYGRWWPAIDLGTDDMTSRTARTNFNDWFTHTINPSHVWVESWAQYSSFWVGIARANAVINNVPNIAMNETKKNALLGEARALRALYYLHLVKTYGDMPIVVNEIKDKADYSLPRSSVEEVYEKIIIPDLKFAEDNCINALHDGHITKWTAKIILADVYLTRAGWRRTSQGQFVQGKAENWTLARDKAKDVLDNSPHTLITTPVINGKDTTRACGVPWSLTAPFSKEAMLELAAINVANKGSWLTRESAPSTNGVSFWGAAANKPFSAQGINSTVSQLIFPSVTLVGLYIPTPDLWRSFEAGDQRRTTSILTRYISPDGTNYLIQPTFAKYVDIDFYLGKPNTSFQNTNNNFILYRYADALLIYAEAANEVATATSGDAAYIAVNKIRNRAGLGNLPTNLSQDAFRNAVWKERRSEFVGECKRRFDLIRTKRLATETAKIDVNWLPSDNPPYAVAFTNSNVLYTGTVPFPDREWLMPIPFSEIQLNKGNGWVQNEGY